ncbi:uncharacterized protein LOC126316457 [Schistocerca gregaria]|uniref:uncharacterized protein LOC126316457 n=1 Tax=Schistocerca gregaria TaxID=7010 RepID=UPI00211DD5A5|nr:uncharacterized protein LOC126316457 [Schistocerca gregaria]
MQSENQADPPLAERPHHASPPDPRDDNLLATALKQLQSTQVLADWMSHYRSAIEDVPLCHVALPGTHDSGTYSLDPHCPYSIELRGSRMINLASLVGLGRLAKQIVLKWAVCQDQDTETQLAAGIRYFDLRVVAVKDEYRICHGLCGGLISDMLATFSNFVRAHPREIVILDLVPKNFYEFGVHSTLQIDHHLHFSKMLCDALQGVMCSSEHLRCDSTLREFWDSNTNIIVLYDPPPDLSPDLARLFWPPRSIQSYWPRHCKNALSWTKWAATHLSARPPLLRRTLRPSRRHHPRQENHLGTLPQRQGPAPTQPTRQPPRHRPPRRKPAPKPQHHHPRLLRPHPALPRLQLDQRRRLPPVHPKTGLPANRRAFRLCRDHERTDAPNRRASLRRRHLPQRLPSHRLPPRPRRGLHLARRGRHHHSPPPSPRRPRPTLDPLLRRRALPVRGPRTRHPLLPVELLQVHLASLPGRLRPRPPGPPSGPPPPSPPISRNSREHHLPRQAHL